MNSSLFGARKITTMPSLNRYPMSTASTDCLKSRGWDIVLVEMVDIPRQYLMLCVLGLKMGLLQRLFQSASRMPMRRNRAEFCVPFLGKRVMMGRVIHHRRIAFTVLSSVQNVILAHVLGFRFLL